MEGNVWARASVTSKYIMRWGDPRNLKAMELEVFLIDWGYSEKIGNITSNVRLIPENSNFGQIKGLAARVSIDCKFFAGKTKCTGKDLFRWFPPTKFLVVFVKKRFFSALVNKLDFYGTNGSPRIRI